MSAPGDRAPSLGETGSGLVFPAGPVVKICGLTRSEDVQLACRLGAWAVGFVFAPSPRRVTVGAARELSRHARNEANAGDGANRVGKVGPRLDDRGGLRPLVVGVFADSSAMEIAQTAWAVGLDAVQLHGSHGPEAADVREALVCTAPPDGRSNRQYHVTLVIQAVAVAPEDDDPGSLHRRIATAAADADLVLLDTRVAERFGGTGTGFRWELAAPASKQTRFLVAGGIGRGNVRAALRESGAWGVDVSSGIEASPGVKDHGLMVELMKQTEGTWK